MGDVDFEVFVRVGFTSVAVQCEGFPLGRNGGVGDKIGEGVVTLGVVGGGGRGRDGMVDQSGEGGGEVVWGDVGCREVLWVVGWNMCSV